MTRLTSLLALAALVAASTPADAKCAMSHLRPKVLTTSTVTGGGIVVAAEQVPYGVEDKGDAMQPTWQLDVRGTLLAPKIDVLAPGLAVYRLPPSAAEASLVDGKTVIAKVTVAAAADKPAALAAPKVKSIRHDKQLGRRASAYTTVTLDGPPPAGMVALVLADAKGKPRSFGLIEGDAAELRVYEHGRCGVVPNNTVESKIGDRVTLLWVDANGRTSPTSKVLTVTGKTTADRE